MKNYIRLILGYTHGYFCKIAAQGKDPRKLSPDDFLKDARQRILGLDALFTIEKSLQQPSNITPPNTPQIPPPNTP